MIQNEGDNVRRKLESEIMDDELQAIAYAKADFSQSNQWCVDHLISDFPSHLRKVIDIGCGPADVLIRLARAVPGIHITAVDGSKAMIDLARKAVQASGFEKQILPVHGYMPGLPLNNHSYDAILSKDLLHHLPDPMVLWAEAQRLAKPGAAIYFMDLLRPLTLEDARMIVESVAATEHPILKEDFFNSLCAAFTVAEIKEQLKRAGLSLDVAQVSERHILIKGLIN